MFSYLGYFWNILYIQIIFYHDFTISQDIKICFKKLKCQIQNINCFGTIM